MRQNLKEYIKRFNPILETKIFSKKECKKIINILVKNQDKWENRSPFGNFFSSYGALTYLDKKNYKQKSEYFNKILVQDFEWMYIKIRNYYQEKLDKPVVFKKALPGFHIFQAIEQLSYDDVKYPPTAEIHVDLPQKDHKWKDKILATSSFTIAIDLPKCGAGLNIWQNSNIFENINTPLFHQMDKETQLTIIKNTEYFPYKLGYIYEQNGMLRHQITCGGDVMKGEKRITIQGHLVESSKKIIISV